MVLRALRAIIFSFLFTWISQYCSSYHNPLRVSYKQRQSQIFSENSQDLSKKIVRPLGGYERLLSRKNPGTNIVSLSHGSAFLLQGKVDHLNLVAAVQKTMARHPMLRSYIIEDYWAYCNKSIEALADECVQTIEVSNKDFKSEWKSVLESTINNAQFPSKGPLWKLQNIIIKGDSSESAWIFCVNHGMDDQQSVNIMTKDIIENCMSSRKDLSSSKSTPSTSLSLPFPPPIELSVAPEFPGINMLLWSIFQLYNIIAFPVMIPIRISEKMKNDIEFKNTIRDPDSRSTFLEYFSMSSEDTKDILLACRQQGVTITNALSAAMLAVTALEMQSQKEPLDSIKLRFLLSVGLRRFKSSSFQQIDQVGLPGNMVDDWTQGTVASASGAVDFIVTVPSTIVNDVANLSSTAAKTISLSDARESLWKLVNICRDRSKCIIEKFSFVPESVRLFGLGMQYADILTVVEQDAKSASLGRGFSCGVSNVGVFNFQINLNTIIGNNTIRSPPSNFFNSIVSKLSSREEIPSKAFSNTIRVKEAYYATSHARNGVFAQLSCITPNSNLCGCLQFTSPMMTRSEAAQFKEKLIQCLRLLSS